MWCLIWFQHRAVEAEVVVPLWGCEHITYGRYFEFLGFELRYFDSKVRNVCLVSEMKLKDWRSDGLLGVVEFSIGVLDRSLNWWGMETFAKLRVWIEVQQLFLLWTWRRCDWLNVWHTCCHYNNMTSCSNLRKYNHRCGFTFFKYPRCSARLWCKIAV